MKYVWKFSNGLLVLITNDNIPAPVIVTENFFCDLRRNDLVKDVLKTILSTLTSENVFHARMTEMIQKNLDDEE